MADRDHALERELLVRTGGTPEFVSQVRARLDRYEAEHGNSGWDVDVDELLAEAQEECADIAGWGMGAALQLEPVQLHRLVVATRLGAAAHRELAALREQIALQRGS